jgi:hypothetical protein
MCTYSTYYCTRKPTLEPPPSASSRFFRKPAVAHTFKIFMSYFLKALYTISTDPSTRIPIVLYFCIT